MTKITDGNVLRVDHISYERIRSLDRQRTMVIATLSPIEVHGPHLPLGQDLMQAYAVVEHTAKRMGERRKDWTFLLLPPVPVAADCVPEVGSMEFPVRLVRETAYHLLRPFAEKGFGRLAFGSFHGGFRHILCLEVAAEELTRRFGIPSASFFSMVLTRLKADDIQRKAAEVLPERAISFDELKWDLHAGMIETSLGLHLWPQLVETGWEDLDESTPRHEQRNEIEQHMYGSAAREGLTGTVRRLMTTVRTVRRARRFFARHTYFGFPALASAQQGRVLFEHVVNLSVAAADDLIDKGMEVEVHSPMWRLRHLLLNRTTGRMVERWASGK